MSSVKNAPVAILGAFMAASGGHWNKGNFTPAKGAKAVPEYTTIQTRDQYDAWMAKKVKEYGGKNKLLLSSEYHKAWDTHLSAMAAKWKAESKAKAKDEKAKAQALASEVVVQKITGTDIYGLKYKNMSGWVATSGGGGILFTGGMAEFKTPEAATAAAAKMGKKVVSDVPKTAASPAALQKIPAGKASAMYWADLYKAQRGGKIQSLNDQELEAALLDGAKHKRIAQNDGQIVGAVAYHTDGPSVHVEHLGSIQPGVGRRLMQEVEKVAVQQGKPVTLVSSKEAGGFYTKLGYKQDADSGMWRKTVTKGKK